VPTDSVFCALDHIDHRAAKLSKTKNVGRGLLMSSKRALVVDDSKSARAFLARILERHEIAVDAAESAEAAIDYLTRHKPDVIFMDHLMPGMDGFQAVQSIKNNPRTSSIPILMYTSQEGDLYLGQARALGAEGVLPKQIKQADVTRMLFQLRLVSDRRSRDQTTYSALENAPDLLPANESAIIVDPPREPADTGPVPAVTSASTDAVGELLPRLSLEIRAAVDSTLQREIAALRGFIGSRLDTHSERLQGDLSALLPGPRIPEAQGEPLIPERRVSTWIGWTLAVLALAASGTLSWLWWTRGGEIAALQTDLTAAYAELETLRAEAAAAAASAAEAAEAAAAAAAAAAAPVTETASVAATVDASLEAPAPQPAARPGAAASPVVQLVPTGGVITPPAPAAEGTPAAAAPSQAK
jgi:CheY-like chemotaxis protein